MILYTTGSPLLDLLQQASESPPVEGQRVLCRHAFDEAKRAYVCPSNVESLLKLCWKDGEVSLGSNYRWFIFFSIILDLNMEFRAL